MTLSWMDISRPIRPNEQKIGAFGLPSATATPVRCGSFVGDVTQGGPCNCDQLTLYVHANGTHTESAGHLCGEPRIFMTERYPPVLMMALLISVCTRKWHQDLMGDFHSQIYASKDDWVITKEDLQLQLDRWLPPPSSIEKESHLLSNQKALIVRLYRQEETLLTFPYWIDSAASHVRHRGFHHLLIETPSLDRESDGGKLSSHRSFFGENLKESTHTLTELCQIPEAAQDGWYWLNLQCTPLCSDAVPSRPMILPFIN
jgi:arylformamidase